MSRKGRAIRASYVRTADQAADVMKCRRNPFYFISTYIHITHPTRGDVPFRMYPFQVATLLGWLKHQAVCMLKPRQMGISTLIAAYLLWFCLFHSHRRVLIISIKQSTARDLMRRIKHMYLSLPDHLRVEVVNGGRGEPGTADAMIFANGSALEVAGSTPDAGRSGSYSIMVMDEAAFQRHADTTFGAAGPATLSNDGQVIVLSTAFGMDNFFHKTYVGARAGTNGFHAQRLKWQMHPSYTPEWYKQQVPLLGRLRVAQEIDCNFLTSGLTVFDMGSIREIEDRIRYKTPEKRRDGELLLFEKPVPGVRYWIGADVATGRARDYSTFSIQYNVKGQGREVGCFKGKLGVREFASLLADTGAEYNTATLAPEINSIGEGVIASLQGLHYPEIFSNVSNVLKLDQYETLRDYDTTVGWMTTSKSRHEIITGMDDDLRDEVIELNNPFFCAEASSFIYHNNGRASALGKGGQRSTVDMYAEDGGAAYSDDAILGTCITNAVRKAPERFSAPLPIWTGG